MTVAMKKLVVVTLALGTMLAIGTAASAQVLNSGPQTINLNATLAESLTLNLSGNAVSFTLVPGSATNAGSTNITATTTWVLAPGRNAVTVSAYFDSSDALTDGGTNVIPSSAFTISDNSGAATPLTGVTPFGANGYQMENIPITAANRSGNVADTMAFNINLSTLPQLPAATYTGHLNIRAQATP